MTNASPSTRLTPPGKPVTKPIMSPMSAGPAWKDWNIARYAREGNFILVTNNGSDFRRFYSAVPLHAGLIILIPTVSRILQRHLFEAALDELAVVGEPVNRVLEVGLDGNETILTLYDLPSGEL